MLCRLQIVRRITERGYRNVGSSKNPDASITGALSRDILFTRLGPATYALAVRNFWLAGYVLRRGWYRSFPQSSSSITNEQTILTAAACAS